MEILSWGLTPKDLHVWRPGVYKTWHQNEAGYKLGINNRWYHFYMVATLHFRERKVHGRLGWTMGGKRCASGSRSSWVCSRRNVHFILEQHFQIIVLIANWDAPLIRIPSVRKSFSRGLGRALECCDASQQRSLSIYSGGHAHHHIIYILLWNRCQELNFCRKS